jgi:fucose permease
MPLVEPRFRVLFPALFAVFVLFGTSITIIGATLPRILTDFRWNYAVAGEMIGAGAVAYFVSTFAAGYLIKHWGPKPTLLLGILLEVVGLSFFATTPDPLTNTLLSALIGLGQGPIEVTVNHSILRIDQRNTGRPMNVMHGAFAVGAILGPIAVGALLKGGLNWAVVYRGMALIFVLLAVMMGFMPLPRAAGNPDGHGAGPKLSRNPAYWLSFFALFFYVGVELGVSNWVAQYFVAVFSCSAAASALQVSLFWAGLLAGRFGVPLLYRGTRHDRVLMGFATLAATAVVLITLLGYAPPGAITSGAGMVLVGLAGLGCSVCYPEVITLLGKCFPQAQSQAIGFAATGGGIGAFAFPFVMSAISQHWGIRAGFATYAVFAVAMAALVAGLALPGAKTRAGA